MTLLTQERLKEVLSYDPETGVFTRIRTTCPRAQAGKVVGSKSDEGYLRVRIDGQLYPLHRLAWLYMDGKFPKGDVDHINHDRTDNRIRNLRVVTPSENMKNQAMRCTNTSGVMGVSWNKRDNKWMAYIWSKGKMKHLGRYSDYFNAVCVRKAAEIRYGFHENHGAC